MSWAISKPISGSHCETIGITQVFFEPFKLGRN
jgi:hypothetical protein